MPFPWKDVGEIILGAAVMVGVLMLTRAQRGLLALGLQVSTGAVTYLAVLVLLNLVSTRAELCGPLSGLSFNTCQQLWRVGFHYLKRGN
jgi:hypothetical protein